MNPPTQYVYADNADAAELKRLRLLESVADIDTLRILDQIGVRPGWRCLEVAAGAGSVARALAQRVGADGEVTAIDMDPRFLMSSAGPNLTIRRADVLTDDLGVDTFDLVHTRHLLAHLGVRAADAVARMAAAVRSGGWLVVEDIDLTHPPAWMAGTEQEAAVERVMDGFRRVITERGGDPRIGRRLPLLLEHAGLVDVEVDARMGYRRPGDTGLDMARTTLAAVRPALLGAGVEASDVDAVLDGFDAHDFRGFDPVQVAAWGRKPS